MQCLINSMIYLVAIMGIIFTTLTLFEMFAQEKKQSTYRIYNKCGEFDGKVEVIVKLKCVEEEEEKKIVKMIKGNEKIDLKDIASCIIIEKSE